MSQIVAMVQLVHFSHDHVLNLVHIQSNRNNESSHDEEENEDDCVVEDYHVGQCNMCKEHIYSFHLSYYDCKNCNYFLHKFCAEIPTTLQNHTLHPNHNLSLSERFQDSYPDHEWTCDVCNVKRKNFFNYHCSVCKFNMDIICATMSQQKMNHPSHPHQLQRMLKKLLSYCNACGHEHEGTFYHCTTCSWPWIHQDCALLPAKLFIQQPTNDTFTHSHPLTLAYSFPIIDQKFKFYPRCRVCGTTFNVYFWLYKCDRCQYYVHISCATSNYVKFLLPGRGKTHKNFKEYHYRDLLICPFPDESYNLLKHQYFNYEYFTYIRKHGKTLNHMIHQHPLVRLEKQTLAFSLRLLMNKNELLCNKCVRPITTTPFYKCSVDVEDCDFVFQDCHFSLHEWCFRHLYFNYKGYKVIKKHGKTLNHCSHQHPLVLLDTQTSLANNSVFLHNSMKKIQLLCYGCVKPITTIPFYKCSEDVRHCGFVLHEWCTRLPSGIKDHPCHPKHELDLMTNIPRKFFSVFECQICLFPSNGFAYGCTTCDFYVDINCVFLPGEITHEAHPNHLLMSFHSSMSQSKKQCDACNYHLQNRPAYYCPTCDFYLDTECAFLLPKTIRHKYDKHPLSLRYTPAENHPGDYFCEICEEQFNPESWYYYCSFCTQSIHPACSTIILNCEQSVYAKYKRCVFNYVNVKFGGTLEIKGHPHRLAFVQGIKSHGQCKLCDEDLHYKMIFKCLECDYALDYRCASSLGK